MREVRVLSGLGRKALLDVVGQRQVLVWGGQSACLEVLAALHGYYGIRSGRVVAMRVDGFERYPGFQALTPAALAQEVLRPEQLLVVVASVGFRAQILAQLATAGFSRGRDILLHTALQRRRAVVRLAAEAESASFAPERILQFFHDHRSELEGASLELSCPGGPSDWCGAEALARELVLLGPLSVSTAFPGTAWASWRLPRPFVLRLAVFGDVAAAARHTPALAAHFDDAAYAEAVQTLVLSGSEGMRVEVTRQDASSWSPEAPMARVLWPKGLGVFDDLSHPLDYSLLMAHVLHSKVSDSRTLRAQTGFDLEEGLQRASAQAGERCMCERVFPVLNGDGALAVCHLHSRGVLYGDPRGRAFEQVAQRRQRNHYCRLCQSVGLHRFDANLLGMHAVHPTSSTHRKGGTP